ncbi:hypothetical protein B6V73_00060 [Thioclava sp. JM3]|uniref:helix-turn-helix transcriptional regulator n=1 Tax=Thioclava sp. JM3 TaxID=1973004 RepID=UPI000B539CFD|nr:hypothetical protein [Thioclava sp. JM3]OWY18249.1 hypothetical protein B6V73_00060 [Thioclava sp. JM3]
MNSALESAIRQVARHNPEAFAAAVTHRLVALPYGSGTRALIAALDDLLPDRMEGVAALAEARAAASVELRDARDFLVSTNDLARRYGVSPRVVWNTVQHQEGFPKSFKASSGQSVWRLSEVAAWEDCEARE